MCADLCPSVQTYIRKERCKTSNWGSKHALAAYRSNQHVPGPSPFLTRARARAAADTELNTSGVKHWSYTHVHVSSAHLSAVIILILTKGSQNLAKVHTRLNQRMSDFNEFTEGVFLLASVKLKIVSEFGPGFFSNYFFFIQIVQNFQKKKKKKGCTQYITVRLF